MIRLLENLLVVLPFVIFLLYKQQFYPILILVSISVLMILINFKTSYHFTIPTPFHKRPFEFTVGFRNTFPLFLLAYGLTIIAVVVGNFNLGIFALMLIFLTVLSFYVKPENEYFVWSYSKTPAGFLFDKIKTAFLYVFYLCVPALLLLSLFFFEEFGILLLFTLLGYLYLTMIICAKYAAYPNEMNIAQVIIIVLSFVFPPLLLVFIPFLANQSIYKLNGLLR
jgi:hypothetical protein